MYAQSTTPSILLSRETPSIALEHLPVIARSALKMAINIEFGSLKVILPGQHRFLIEGAQPGPNAEVTIHDYAAIRRLFWSSDIGFAEAYFDEMWSSPDVTDLMELFVINGENVYKNMSGSVMARTWMRLLHWMNRNTHSGSKRNISAHYDLGNRFYEQWLDPSMTYSSAYFGDGANDLESAQTHKYRKLATDSGIGENAHVLEIGCGWGGFAEFAAREIGCRVTALTISREQHDYARKRIFDAGLSDKVDIKFQDYRDESGRYDHIASIEMFEAVGEKYWPTFFSRMRSCLKDGGTAGLQTITIAEHMFETYRANPDFIQRYIFPGGMLPTGTIMRDLGQKSGMPLKAETGFGKDYALTLREWRRRFDEKWLQVKPLGFDERFQKLWRYYMHYCEAGFRSGQIDVRQMIFHRQS